MKLSLALSTTSPAVLNRRGGISAGVSAPHWRVRVYRNNGDTQYTNFAEIQWLNEVGTPISTSGGTASGSTVQAGSHAELYDGNINTFCQIPTTTNCYFAMQFASSVKVGGVSLTPYSTFTTRAGRTMDIQYSYVGGATDSNWITLFTITQTSWTASTPQSFTKPTLVAHRYWRNVVSELNAGGSTLAFSEMQFRETVGVAQNPSGGTALFASQQAGFPASNLFDNNTSTLYAATDGSFSPMGDYVGYDYGTAKVIRQVQFTARADGFPEQAPRSGSIQSGPDGIVWLPRGSYSGLTYTLGSSNLVTL